MALPFEESFVKRWFDLRAVDGVLGLGFEPRIVDGKLVSARQLMVYKVDKESSVPENLEAEVRLPKLTNRRITVKERHQCSKCLTDYQWVLWDKIDKLNKSQKGGGAAADPAITTRIVDDVFVIHDPNGSLVTQVGTQTTVNFVEAYRIFRGAFGDDYDFLAFFVDLPSGMPDIGNGSTPIFNDVSGIGRTVPDGRAAWNSTRLRLCTHFTWITLRSMLHEPAHLWCSYVQYRLTADGPTEVMLHADFTGAADQSGLHWGRFMDDSNSCMDYDRCDWSDNGDGTFNRFNRQADETSPVRATCFGYCPLDLYLMGFLGPKEVPDWTMICNPTPAIDDHNFGPYTPAPPGGFKLGVKNVIFENGPRTPDHLSSPRIFHQAVIVVTKNPDPNADFIADVAAKQARHVDNFRRATRGLAVTDCSLLRDNYRDLYIKHTPADDGTPSSVGDFFDSPDIWVRNSPNGDSNFESQLPQTGTDNWIYARIRNKGSKPYHNVRVNFYVTTKPHLDVRYPDDWHPDGKIGSALITTVPAASGGGAAKAEGTAISNVRWPSDRIPPATGVTPSVLCEIIPMEVAPAELHAVWQNPKLAQRLVD